MCFFCQKMTYPDNAHALVSAEPAIRANAGGVVTDYTALLSNKSWWGGTPPGKSMIVSYSFETSSDRYDYTVDGFSALFLNSFRPFSAAEKALALQALNLWAADTGLIFVEADSNRGDIRFGVYDFLKEPGYKDSVGFGYYPSEYTNSSDSKYNEYGGDVFMNQEFMKTSSDVEKVGVILHEIGHAIGLKHPFDGGITLATYLDNVKNTVMSYTGWYTEFALGKLDIDAAKYFYGSSAAETASRESWSWNAETDTLFQKGSSSNDTIRGAGGFNVIDGGAGNDLIIGRNLNDTLQGGRGSDVLFGLLGNDTFLATALDVRQDTFVYGLGYDTLHLLEGRGIFTEFKELNLERITSSTSSITLQGTSLANVLDFRPLRMAGPITIDGGGGNDQIWGTSSSETFVMRDNSSGEIFGGLGLNTLDFTRLSTSISIINIRYNFFQVNIGALETEIRYFTSFIGSRFNDSFLALETEVFIDGASGSDYIQGYDFSDTIVGGLGADTLDGGLGFSDILSYQTTSTAMTVTLGPTWIISGAFERIGDVFSGFEGIRTGTGNDLLNGSALEDQMQGWLGNDTLVGGTGNDTLNGGEGKDRFTGGGGQDVFVFATIADSGAAFLRRDVINTFVHGDKIDLRLVDAQSNVSGDQAFRFIADQAFSGNAGELRFSLTNISATGVKAYLIEADTDGNRAADFSLQIYTAPTMDRTGQPQTWNLYAWDFLL